MDEKHKTAAGHSESNTPEPEVAQHLLQKSASQESDQWDAIKARASREKSSYEA